jgi:FkbM family methyltransferase
VNNLVEKNTKYGYMAYFKNDMSFADTLFHEKIYEEDFVMEFLQDTVSSSKTILDIGSHAGSHTVLYKHINPDCEIYCFEPQSEMFNLLQHNVSKNSFNNVKTFNKGVANVAMKSSMSKSVSDGDNAGRNIEYGTGKRFNLGGLQIGNGGEEIETMTVDSLDLQSCDYIKIDVEGFEPLVLMGAEQTIKKFKPVILFESNHKVISKEMAEKFGLLYPVDSSFDILKSYGYKEIKLIDNLWNYLATF